MKILVCDDDAELRAKWVADVRSALPEIFKDSVGPLERPGEEFRILFGRQHAIRHNSPQPTEISTFDDTDVLVVDYDLVFVDDKEARHTGEELARLCRIFSTCKYIIVLNQGNRTMHFDLTLGTRDRSYADLNIAALAVGQPSLWGEAESVTFRPWHWRNISLANKARETLAAEIARDGVLESSILDFIGMPDAAASAMSFAAFEFIGPDKKDIAELRTVTFSEFLCLSTEHRDLELLLIHNRHAAARVAVARLSKWLCRIVLGPQDVLVDVPHLLQRMPYLMSSEIGDPNNPESWARVVAEGERSIDSNLSSELWFERACEWIGRPALWWPNVDGDEYVAKLRADFDFANLPDLVFAEDVSSFIPADGAHEFRSDFTNRFGRRHVQRVDGLKYGPPARFLEF